MSFLEAVIVAVQVDCILVDLIGWNGRRVFKALAKAATENLIGDHQLVSSHRLVVGEVLRINVDQFYHPIAVRAGGRSEEVRHDISADYQVVFEYIALPTDDVTPVL